MTHEEAQEFINDPKKLKSLIQGLAKQSIDKVQDSFKSDEPCPQRYQVTIKRGIDTTLQQKCCIDQINGLLSNLFANSKLLNLNDKLDAQAIWLNANEHLVQSIVSQCTPDILNIINFKALSSLVWVSLKAQLTHY